MTDTKRSLNDQETPVTEHGAGPQGPDNSSSPPPTKKFVDDTPGKLKRRVDLDDIPDDSLANWGLVPRGPNETF